MAGICFFFEDSDADVWSGKNLDAWNYSCKVGGGIDKAIVINKTSQVLQSFDAGMDIQFVADLAAAQAIMAGEIIYLAVPWDTMPVSSIAGNPHTADWYVFGPAAGWGSYNIPSGKYLPQAGIGAVHSVHIATALMFHRYWTLNV